MIDSQQENPYAAPAARVADIRVENSTELASRGQRLAAALIDGLVFAVAYIPLVFAMGLGQPSHSASKPPMGAILGGLAVLALMAVNLYFLHRDGQSLGKKAVGIRIRRSDGSPASLGRLVGLRIIPTSVLGAIPLLGGLISLFDILLIFGSERRCLHDRFADTIVVAA